ncbi:hypothetical protein PACTADRAFT_1622 [Pachysolen tannophilus NRRL Y-2460]|uniref:ATP synthase subunit K, mitochondrial n=1 Tax=Pachysolen tannophilus NRRL Y-2460 TaxID=669874 RepID=A0A1E4TZ70_PACTA|nr:hypothetical protein PACTADRAFT_1622 [Pachysolen tannophilus NRRL Y-2460]
MSGPAYQILGRSVQPHQLAIATLSTVLFFVIPKPWGSKTLASPSIGASSPEEEKFIKEYLAKKEKSE